MSDHPVVKREPEPPPVEPNALEVVTSGDGYRLAIRVWRAHPAQATLVMLHGIVSHSGWMEPIASRLAGHGITTVCPDRRGAGINEAARGDAPDRATLIEDLDSVLASYGDESASIHLAGFCWGATYAVNFLANHPASVRSLSLIAPSIFPARELRDAEITIGESHNATLDPIVPIDAFTNGPEYEQFIVPDPHRLRKVSPRMNATMLQLSRMVGVKLARLTLPILTVLAETDRITDNEVTRRAFRQMKASPKRLVTVPGWHGVQFDAPQESSKHVADWILEPALRGHD